MTSWHWYQLHVTSICKISKVPPEFTTTIRDPKVASCCTAWVWTPGELWSTLPRWQWWLQHRALRRCCGQGKKNGQQLGLGNNRNTEAPAPGLVLAGRIQYRPHSYNHTLTMGLVWAGSELRTLAPWPPHCISTMRSMVQWPQYRLVSLSTKHANIRPQHHCMGSIRYPLYMFAWVKRIDNNR